MAYADFFSRNPLPERTTSASSVKFKKVLLTEISREWLQAEQQRDPELSHLMLDLESHKLSPELAKTYEIRSGLLHRKIKRNHRSHCIPIVPQNIRWSIINNIHESLVHLGGH